MTYAFILPEEESAFFLAILQTSLQSAATEAELILRGDD